MRIFSFLPFLACFPLLMARSLSTHDTLASSDTLSPLTVPLHQRMALQSRATLDICANVRVTIPGITLLGIPLTSIQLNQLCLCLNDGLLTAGSKDTIRLSFQSGGANAGLLDGVLKLVGGLLSNLLGTVESLATTLLGGRSTSCVYPANSIPNDCSTACGFACEPTFQLCNGQCVPLSQTCATGGGGTTGRKRKLPQHIREDLRCQKGFDACRVPHASDSLRLSNKAFDCVDIKTDLESCGGCMYPTPEQSQGQDCTAIPSTASVSCVNFRCVVESCMRGFLLQGGACIPSGTGRMVVGEQALWALRTRL